MWGSKCIVPVVTAQMEHLGPNLVTLGHLITFFQARYVTIWGVKTA